MNILLSFTFGLLSLFGVASAAVAAEYAPEIDPKNFTTTIDNPYFTLTPGTTFSFRSQTEDGTETQKMVVTNLTREVMGVTALVVWDRVWLENELIEETYDWYAQDTSGNVWYLGEESREYENGQVKNTHGSWEGGVDGALPGIMMQADPKVGDTYKQEFYSGVAEDMAEVVALNETVETPYGSFTDCLKTKDTTPLEPSVLEFKYYCPEVGMYVLEDAGDQKNKLIDVQLHQDSLAPQAGDVNGPSDLGQDWMVAGVAGLLGLLLGLAIEKLSHGAHIPHPKPRKS